MNYFARLWHYVRRYRLRLAAGVFFGVLSAVLNVASLPAIKKVFETLFEEEGPQSLREVLEYGWLASVRGTLEPAIEYLLADRLRALVILMTILVVVKLLQGLLKALQEYYTCYLSGRSTIDISNELYHNVIDLPVPFFGQARNSKVVSRFTNDMYNIERGLDTLFGKTLREPLYLAGIPNALPDVRKGIRIKAS